MKNATTTKLTPSTVAIATVGCRVGTWMVTLRGVGVGAGTATVADAEDFFGAAFVGDFFGLAVVVRGVGMGGEEG